jgi:hypothetical protein
MLLKWILSKHLWIYVLKDMAEETTAVDIKQITAL